MYCVHTIQFNLTLERVCYSSCYLCFATRVVFCLQCLFDHHDFFMVCTLRPQYNIYMYICGGAAALQHFSLFLCYADHGCPHHWSAFFFAPLIKYNLTPSNSMRLVVYTINNIINCAWTIEIFVNCQSFVVAALGPPVVITSLHCRRIGRHFLPIFFKVTYIT